MVFFVKIVKKGNLCLSQDIKMQVLIVIPARGGSKGIPRKNLRLLGGKPLIYYTIKNALQISTVPVDVFVSSDDDEILSVSKKIGAECFKRADVLAGDDVTLDSVIFDVYDNVKKQRSKDYDLIITLQPTSPLLEVSSIEKSIQFMLDNPQVDTLISCKEDTHLSWSKVDGAFQPNYEERLNRQYLKPEYRETGGILITRNHIITPTGRIGKKVHLFELSNKETIDIDTYEDWSVCEFYLNRKKILFVITGYQEVGLGHVYNSTLIASDIMEHELEFLVDHKSQLAFDKIASLNFKVSIQQSDNIVDDIKAINPDVVISDILDTSEEYVVALQKAGIKTINFEDLGKGAAQADLVFNAIYPEVEKKENHFFGPDYFCIRDEFILSEQHAIKPNVQRVLLSFGGVDPANNTKRVLDTILPRCEALGIQIDIVTGFGYKRFNEIEQYTSDVVSLHRDVKNISDFMLAADLAFTSGGRTTYELALIGVPTIVICQNKRELTHFFANKSNGFSNLGLYSDVSDQEILETFNALLNYEERLNRRGLMEKNKIREGRQNVVKKIKDFINN